MGVNCRVEFKDGTSTGIKEWECFGFMYSFERTKELFGLETLDYVQGITFFPELDEEIDELSATDINTYLKLLQEIGINKVIKTPKVMDYSNFTDGVYADMCTTSGQAFVGAFELIRNIQYSPVFVKLVTSLYNAGVSGEVALFIPRFLKGSILSKDSHLEPPSADTTSSYYGSMLVNNEKLFSKEVLANKSEFLPWIESGDFTGVFGYYNTGGPRIHIGSKTFPLLGRTGALMREAVSIENGVPPYSDKILQDYFLLEGIYEERIEKKRGFGLVLELCKHYELTGELP